MENKVTMEGMWLSAMKSRFNWLMSSMVLLGALYHRNSAGEMLPSASWKQQVFICRLMKVQSALEPRLSLLPK